MSTPSRRCWTPLSATQAGMPVVLVADLLQDREVTWVPCLGDDIQLVAKLPKYRVMDMLEVCQAQILLRHDRGNHLVVFEDVDRRALGSIRAIERTHNRIRPQIVNVARQ